MKTNAQENALIRAGYPNDFFSPYGGEQGDDVMSSPAIRAFDETADTPFELATFGDRDAVPAHTEREPRSGPQRARPDRGQAAPSNTAGHAPSFGSPQQRVLNSVKSNGRWLPLDAVGLALSVMGEKENPSPVGKAAIASSALFLGGSLAHIGNLNDYRPLAQASKGMTTAGLLIGTGLDVTQLVNDVKDLKTNPGDEQAKWNVGNSAAHLGVNIGALAASVICPPAALVPLIVPDFGQIHQAESLRKQEADLRAQGRSAEAGAIHSEYKIAALNSTPLINWFPSLYGHRMQPEVVKFEESQGNKPGGKPLGEIPPEARNSKAVLQYYGKAMEERAHAFADGALPSLRKAAQEMDADSVTTIVHAPQQFDWPSAAAPMRVFDRAIVATYSRKTDSVHAEFFGKDKDGAFRLPYLNQGTEPRVGAKNFVVVTRTDADPAATRFELDAYKNDRTGSVMLIDPDHNVV